MPDPTEMVLTGSVAAAFVIFAVVALAGWARGKVCRSVVVGTCARTEEGERAAPAWEEPPPARETGGVPVWFYRPVDLLGACFVFGVFGVLGLSAAGHAGDALPAMGPTTLLVNIGFQFVMAGVVAIGVVRRVGWVAWLGLRWPGWPWVFLIAPCAVLFMWAVFGSLLEFGYTEWMESLGAETVQDTVKLLQQSEDPRVLGLMAFAAVVAAPLCEEMVFRGYFYPVLKKFAGTWVAAVCSALVFATAHGNLSALLPLFVFGGVLVFVYEKTGSLWAPIAVHFCFNSATVVAQIAARYFHLPLDVAP